MDEQETSPKVVVTINAWWIDVIKDVSAVLGSLMILWLGWVWLRDVYLLPFLYRL